MGSTFHEISTSFNDYFKISEKEDIFKFFPEQKNDVREILKTKVERLTHFAKTGVLINEGALCKWAEQHADDRLSQLFSQKPLERKLIRHEQKMLYSKDSVWKSIKTAFGFIFEFIKHPTEVGAILPSSRGLAKEIVGEIPKDLTAKPRRILEVGPGTGVFTEKIVKRMNPQDELVLVEFDEKFCNELRKKFANTRNVTIIQGDIAQHKPDQKYDFIISGLPLNAFKSDFVGTIFDKFEKDLIKDNGKISYFEYIGVPEVKMLLANTEDKENLGKILELKKKFYKKYKLRTGEVYFNAPAARVLHHQMVKNAAA
jgi:phospholipid N-methyltransferase